MSEHPDAELLALCAKLAEMQAEWQRLYDATSETGPLTTPEDHAWDAYSNMVWPALKLSSTLFYPQPQPDDVPGRLLRIRATTQEGQAAKAAAILAMDEVSAWCDIRDDSIELLHSLARDIAGIQSHHLGASAPGLEPVEAAA